MRTETVASLNLAPGTLYDRMRLVKIAQNGSVTWEPRCWGRYRVVCEARMDHSGQDVVVYEGLNNGDRGKCFCCPIMDFAVNFRRVKAVAIAEPERELVADMSDKGTGV